MDINQLFELLDQIPKNDENEELIEETRKAIEEGDYREAIDKINQLYRIGTEDEEQQEQEDNQEEIPNENSQDVEEFNYIEDENYDQQEQYEDSEDEQENEEYDNNDNEETEEMEEELEEDDDDEYDDEELMVDEGTEENDEEDEYPKELINPSLEETYIGMLLNNPKAMSMYYIVFTDCYFESNELLNIYKSILFTEGQAYAPELAKRRFNFATETTTLNESKEILKEKYADKNYNFEKVYVEIRKLFLLRKHYRGMPIKTTQKKIAEIVNYYLYDKMSIEEVEAAVEQVTVTQKFKSAILSKGTSNFLMQSDNNLTTGLKIPFKILSSVFKGIRKGETTSFSMPSNSGKSRFTIALAAYIAFVHKKKVLVISNEMSEEKMKLCLITTILNNPEIQKLHGQKMIKSEGELLEFKFRPDDPSKVNVDKDGFVVKEPKETQTKFAKRLEKVSEEYRKVIRATNWLDQQLENSIYFINITDHTNDELKKVIVNYYYKEKIEYMFYDTMKTDTENIGNGEELKKTATILSNLAQDFNIYIGSTLQLTETATLPINLSISDLAVSRTVKEVLDTLCLIKQIPHENYKDYEYSEKEVGDNWKDLEVFKDPDVRYYACVVDKNRAGAKPKVLFRLNLAYNIWEELGYLRLKSNGE